MLTIVAAGAGYSVSWSGTSTCWKLQGSPTLVPSAFVTIEGHSPVAVANDSGMKFFRMIAAPNP